MTTGLPHRPLRLGPRRVTSADFVAIDLILDECWDEGKPMPRWAAARLRSIVKKGLPPVEAGAG